MKASLSFQGIIGWLGHGRTHGPGLRARWRGDRERERDRGYERDHDWENKSRSERGRAGERDRERGGRGDREDRADRGGDRGDRGDRGERGRKRERERGRSGSPRHEYQWAPSDDYDGRRDSSRAQGRSRGETGGGSDLMEIEKPHKRGSERREDEVVMKDSEGQRAAIVAEFVDGIVREHEQLAEASLHAPPPPPPLLPPGPPAAPQPDEEDLMKKMGILVGFNTTKEKYVGDSNHSAVKLTTKHLPRQYMNRRGGFNRPLPAEMNR